MNGAGTRGRQANADLAREFRVRARHERGHLFVAHLNEFELVFELFEGAEQPVDPVAGITINASNAPFDEPLQRNSLAFMFKKPLRSLDSQYLPIPPSRYPTGAFLKKEPRPTRSCRSGAPAARATPAYTTQ